MKRFATGIGTIILLAVVAGLCLIFPKAFEFIELAARDALYLWWVALLLIFALWLIWGFSQKKGD
jgi:hypothetical protein